MRDSSEAEMRWFPLLAPFLSSCALYLDVDDLPSVDMNQGDVSDMAIDMVEDSNLPDLPDPDTPDTEDLSPDLSIPCAAGFYESGADRLCLACDVGTYCAGGSASTLECAPGTWDHDSNPATMCETWQNCLAGYTATDGNATTDRTCTECVSGTFSTTTNASSCAAWSECVSGEYQNVAPTGSNDRVCDACNGNTCASNECQRGYCRFPGFSVIPSGTFMQGSPIGEPGRDTNETQRLVTLTRAFFMKETEVTQDEWNVLMGNNPSNFTAAPAGNRPVEKVSWWDAIAYMNALSAIEGLQQCYLVSGCTGTPGVIGSSRSYSCSSITFEGLDCTGYRLPTEAEWEYAARAGSTSMTYTTMNGDGNHGGSTLCVDPVLSSIAWWCGNATSTTHDVGQKTANAWGLYDMIGNVWEWNWDYYDSWLAEAVTDPTGPTSGSVRVRRGCAFGSNASRCRSAERFSFPPTDRDVTVGFRPARSLTL